MPHRMRRRHRRFKRKRHAQIGGKRIFPRNMLVNPMKSNLSVPMPPNFRTVFTSDLFGQYAVGSGPSLTATVKGNAVYLPWNTVNPFPYIAGTGAPALNAIYPAGLSRFLSSPLTLYQTCRVLASSIKVDVNPTNGGDEGQLVVSPIYSTLYGNAFSAGQGPYNKRKFVPVNSPAMTGTIKSYLTTKRVYASTTENVLGSDNFAHSFNTNPVNAWYWQITYTMCDGAVSSGVVNYAVQVKYYVQFEDLANTALPDT